MYSYLTAIVLVIAMTVGSVVAMASTTVDTQRNVASIYMSIHGGK